MRILLFADARLTMYGACTITGIGEARSASASSRGAGFFQPCGSERKICTTSDPVAAAIASGSSILRCAPIFMLALAIARGYEPSVTASSGDVAAEPLQAQGVEHDEHRRERHRGAGDQRVQQPRGSQRDGGDVVAERPHQVALDVAQRRP